MKTEREQVEASRLKWLEASQRAADAAAELHQPGSGYGDCSAREQDEHRLDTARSEADRCFREYDALDRRATNSETLALLRSQMVATWAAVVVAAVVGIATIIALFR